MDLGQGIANAGNLFGQALLSKQEREDRLKREALAQANELADQNYRQEQLGVSQGNLDLSRANQLYDQSWRTISNAPEGATVDQSTYEGMHPGLRDMYTRPQMELPGRTIGMGSQEAPAATGRYSVESPYRKELEVQRLRNQGTQTVEQLRAASRAETARLRMQLSPYQEAMIRARQDTTRVAQGHLRLAESIHDDLMDRIPEKDLATAQLMWDKAVMMATARNSNYEPPLPRPTAPPKGGTAPTTFDAALSNIAKQFDLSNQP